MGNWRDRIEINPAVLVGKPVIRGTRLGVAFIVELLAGGWTEDDLLREYPGLAKEDILACLAYAAERLGEERVFPLAG